MALKVAVLLAAAASSAPVDHKVHNLTHIQQHASEAVVHKPANRTKLATVHASLAVTKKVTHNQDSVHHEKAVHVQNRTTVQHSVNGSAHTTANSSLPTHEGRNQAVRAAIKAQPAHILKADARSPPGVHAYPMTYSKTSKVAASSNSTAKKQEVKYSVAKLNHVFAAKKSDQCQCEFAGICEPAEAMDFMGCLQKACSAESKCACEENQYINACHQLEDACKGTNLELKCFADRTDAVMKEPAAAAKKEPKVEEAKTAPEATPAPVKPAPTKEYKTVTLGKKSTPAPATTKITTTTTTTMDAVVALYADLEKQKDEICSISLSHDAGFLNAAAHKDILKGEIDFNIAKLEKLCKEIPEMHCEKDFHEYSAPHEECNVQVQNEFTKHAFGQPAEPEKKSGCSAVLPGVVSAVVFAATLQ